MGGWSTLESLAHESCRYQVELDLVHTLLGKQLQVKTWIENTAQQQGEARRHLRVSDFGELLKEFAPEFIGQNTPNPGQVGAHLSATMDIIALGETVRIYAF